MSTWYVIIYASGCSIYSGINTGKLNIFLPRGRVFKGGPETVDTVGNVWVKHYHGYSPIYTPTLGVVGHKCNDPIWKVTWSAPVYVFNGPSTKNEKLGEVLAGTYLREVGRKGDWIRHDSGYSLSFNNVSEDRYLTALAELYDDEPDVY